MQISSSYYASRPAYSGSSIGSKSNAENLTPDDFTKLADYGSTQNTIFQNLLKNESVQDNITLNDDGTYSWKANSDGSESVQEWLGRMLISEQNGEWTRSPGSVAPYSVSELTMFRQLTGYNLIQAGAYTVLDDYGNPPPAEDQAMVQAAWDMFDLAKGCKELEAPGANVTVADLQLAGEGLRNQPDANIELFDTLLKMLAERIKPEESATS